MVFLLEYDDERSGTFEPKNKTVVLALVNSVFFKQMPCQDFVAKGAKRGENASGRREGDDFQQR